MLLVSGNVFMPMVAGKGEARKIFIKNRINWIRSGEFGTKLYHISRWVT